MNYYKFIISTIKKAGEMLLSDYRRACRTWTKNNDPRDIVTEVDLKINDFFIEQIKVAYPKHAVYSEEGGGSGVEKEYLWVLDPIDGSANFVRHLPHFAVSVGLFQNGRLLTGAVFNPVTDELFSFKKGRGAFLNNEKISVSAVSDLAQAGIFMVTGRKQELRDWGAGMYRKLLDKGNKTRIFGSSALDLCFLADGRMEGVIYGELTTMDIAPAIGILWEAGGKITGLQGETMEISTLPQKIIASNGTKIHQLLEKIAA